MPLYELVLLFKKLERKALKEALTRSAGYVFSVDGTIRRIENLGLRELPYSITNHGKKHRIGHFFIMNYDSGTDQSKALQEHLKIDLDVVRATNWLRAASPLDLHLKQEKPECTVHLDLLPPPFRPNVIALQAKAKKNKKLRSQNFDDVEFLI